jgi:putative PIN family toxin of toxin-antitoxin system
MIRVVIDTNVLVSALLPSGGLPEAVINLAISGEVQWFASESVLAEYEEVLKRPGLQSILAKPQTQWPEQIFQIAQSLISTV